MLTMVRKKTPKSLEQYRTEKYLDVSEFIEFLGIANHTYYAALRREGIRPSTMRKIAERLGVRPGDITEFQIRREPQA
jgi:hypothetical protein